MKITEFLNYLQKTKASRGDLPVFILSGGKERLLTSFTLNLNGDKIWLLPEADMDLLEDKKKGMK
jgi:hypothetical protein